MRGAYGDEDAGFANFKPPQAVHDSHTVNREFFMDVAANLPHLRNRHGFVGLVFEVQSAATMGLITGKTVEGHDRSILICTDVLKNRCHVDWRMEEFKAIIFSGWIHRGCASASTDRREKGNIIVGRKARVPGGKLLIARSHQRGTKVGQLRKARPVAIEQIG